MTEWKEIASRQGKSGYFTVQINERRRLMWLHLKRNRVEIHDAFHKTYPLDCADARTIMGAAQGHPTRIT